MIREQDFQAYLEVQESGKTNMFDVNKVSELSGLERDKITEIMKNYSDYKEKFITKVVSTAQISRKDLYMKLIEMYEVELDNMSDNELIARYQEQFDINEDVEII